jgi:DKNYY family
MKRTTSIFALLLLTGCQGYKVEKGKWSFVQWNEGYGRMVLTVNNADQESFKPLNRDYAKDNKHVYLWDRVVDGADPNTFVCLGNDYSKDRTKVFLRGKELLGADPNTFQVLEYGWSKDKNDAYAWSRALKVEDLASFTILHVRLLNWWAKDKDAYYIAGHTGKIDCDYATMKILNDSYAVDKDRAYYDGKPIEGVDVKTFRATSIVTARDQYRKYDGESVDSRK